MSGSHHEPVFVQGEARYQDARRVTLVGAVVNIVLSIIKILAGLLGSSHALIADGIHSLSDLATERGRPALDVALDLIEGGSASIVSFNMSEDDVSVV